jgi:hypothetical protein
MIYLFSTHHEENAVFVRGTIQNLIKGPLLFQAQRSYGGNIKSLITACYNNIYYKYILQPRQIVVIEITPCSMVPM